MCRQQARRGQSNNADCNTMTTPNSPLIQQLADKQTRNSARDELLKRGASAVEEVLSKLDEDIELDYRKTILRVLLEIKDPRAENMFRASLSSEDEDIRAIGARGLFSLGAEDALEACLSTINDAPDMLHFDVTSSVVALSEMGIPALQGVLPLLDSVDARTRQRAQKVFELATFNEVSRVVKPRPLSDEARAVWMALWQENGSYRWDAPEELRKTAVKLWEEWLKKELAL
jgi:hypothetical protein